MNFKKILFKKRYELEQLLDFFDDTLGKREDYDDVLKDMIKANIPYPDFKDYISMQENRKQEKEAEDGSKSGIFEIEQNLERGIYLQNILEELKEQNLTFDGRPIEKLYQLVEQLHKNPKTIEAIKDKKAKKGQQRKTRKFYL